MLFLEVEHNVQDACALASNIDESNFCPLKRLDYQCQCKLRVRRGEDLYILRYFIFFSLQKFKGFAWPGSIA